MRVKIELEKKGKRNRIGKENKKERVDTCSLILHFLATLEFAYYFTVFCLFTRILFSSSGKFYAESAMQNNTRNWIILSEK